MKEESKKILINRLAKLSYFFLKEMLKDEQEMEKFDELCRRTSENGGQVVLISAAANKRRVMKDCLKATNDCIDSLREKDNSEYVEAWQEAGINAMFDKCNEEDVIPFDLPYVVQAALGMWNELEERWKKEFSVEGKKRRLMRKMSDLGEAFTITDYCFLAGEMVG